MDVNVQAKEALVPDEGFQFGLGVFETIRMKGQEPEFLKEHLARMCASIAALQIRQIQNRQAEEFDKAVRAWIRFHPAPEKSALKIIVTTENFMCLYRPDPYADQMCPTPCAVDYSPVIRSEQSPLVRHKTLNYGDCILEKRRAAKAGIDELVFCNSRGDNSNLFFVKGGAFLTPAAACGLLPGIIREQMIRCYPVEEVILHPSDVCDMDACFLTNSLMGIRPVAQLGDVRFGINTDLMQEISQRIFGEHIQ